MNNFKCHQCGTELMKTAMTCRSCGAKTKRPSTWFEKVVLIVALLVFLVPLIAAVVAYTKPAAVPEGAQEAPAGGAE